MVAAHDGYAIVEAGGHRYNSFPLGPSLLAWPLVRAFDLFVSAAGPLWPAKQQDWKRDLYATGTMNRMFCATTEMVVASLLIALATVFLYLACGRKLLPAVVFAFMSPAWSTGSRALWQHGPSMLMLAIALWVLAQKSSKGLAGLPLGLSWVIRPTNAISIVVLGAWLLFRHRKQAPLYAGTLLAVPAGRPGRIAFVVAACASLLIRLNGATRKAPYAWNGGPPDVDDAPARVWDWSDSQVLR